MRFWHVYTFASENLTVKGLMRGTPWNPQRFLHVRYKSYLLNFACQHLLLSLVYNIEQVKFSLQKTFSIDKILTYKFYKSWGPHASDPYAMRLVCCLSLHGFSM